MSKNDVFMLQVNTQRSISGVKEELSIFQTKTMRTPHTHMHHFNRKQCEQDSQEKPQNGVPKLHLWAKLVYSGQHDNYDVRTLYHLEFHPLPILLR